MGIDHHRPVGRGALEPCANVAGIAGVQRAKQSRTGLRHRIACGRKHAIAPASSAGTSHSRDDDRVSHQKPRPGVYCSLTRELTAADPSSSASWHGQRRTGDNDHAEQRTQHAAKSTRSAK